MLESRCGARAIERRPHPAPSYFNGKVEEPRTTAGNEPLLVSSRVHKSGWGSSLAAAPISPQEDCHLDGSVFPWGLEGPGQVSGWPEVPWWSGNGSCVP